MKKKDIDALSALYGIEQDKVKELLKEINKITDLAKESINNLYDLLDNVEESKESNKQYLFILYFSTLFQLISTEGRDKVMLILNKHEDINRSCDKQKEVLNKMKQDDG